MKFLRKIVATLLSAVFIFTGFGTTAFAKTQLPEYIRVGLAMSYKDKSSIHIESDEIALVRELEKDGNPLDNEVMAEFSSSTGFNMRVGLSYQVAVPVDADSFDDVKREASGYISDGYANAVPGYYNNDWAVIIYGYDTPSAAGNDAGRLGGQTLAPSEITILDVNGSPILLLARSDTFFMGTGSTPIMDLGARSYRGIIDFIHSAGDRLTAVNVIDFEEYLYGVVTAEIPSSYGYEAIKAQACAARTYAYYKWTRDSDVGYDICDSTHCQAYMGYGYEDDITTQAVIDTEGEMIYYNGKPIEALFFSSSGGYTEDAKNVWGSDVAYLKAVDDSQEINCPEWERTLTLNDLDRLISVNGYGIGSAKGIRLTIDNKTKRVQVLEILGTNGTKKITHESCRTVFGSTGKSFNSRTYTITNGKIVSGGGISQTVNKNVGTFISGPLDNFPKDNYVIGGDCAVIYANTSGAKAYDSKGNEIDINTVPNIDEILNTQTSYQPAATGQTVIESVGSTINIKGLGIGHGVGLSQMGANGMAQNGADYKTILMHYYTGVTVE